MTDERRERGLQKMSEVYGWEVQDGPGDFFGITVDHLFAEIWTRPGLTLRDRRLLLLGLLVGRGMQDVADIQIGAALRRADLTPDELREIAIFLTHYAGWPSGAQLSMQVEKLIREHAKAEHAKAEQAKAEQAQGERAQAEQAQAEHAQAEHAQAEHAQAEHAQAEHAQAEHAQPGPATAPPPATSD